MLKLGLVGKDISHSRSQEMYEKLLGKEVDYHLLDYSSESEVPEAMSYFENGFKGISITFPYKKTFLSSVVVSDPIVNKIEAINCLRFKGGVVEGTNTDLLAAKELLSHFDFQESKFVVLGNGNMAKIFTILLDEYQANFSQYFRSHDGDLNKVNFFEIFKENGKQNIIINCCARAFTFSANAPKDTLFWDMNYSMEEHQKLSKKGMTYREGLDLLELQAKFALEYWEIENL